MARPMFRMPTFHNAAAYLAVTLVAVSVVTALFRPMAALIALVPSAVIDQFFVWQIVTYGFVEDSPMGVIFGAIILFSIGGALEDMWGRRRFLRFLFGVTALAAVATVLLWMVLPGLVLSHYAGGAVMTGALWVAFGLQLGSSPSNFWGMPVTGNMLALIGAGFVLLSGAFAGLAVIVPQLFGLIFTYLYVTKAGPGGLWLRFQSWRLEKDLKKRASHLRSVDGGKRNVRGDSDKYLH